MTNVASPISSMSDEDRQKKCLLLIMQKRQRPGQIWPDQRHGLATIDFRYCLRYNPWEVEKRSPVTFLHLQFCAFLFTKLPTPISVVSFIKLSDHRYISSAVYQHVRQRPSE
ncbi:hypothetical protein CEXT_558921 [Caerostris extrusa]|uniref:Uncharacterized protein n=1 Tax=Caerostris extrusa TaxID=172846 RepID=A0AAV4P021_CAEEX|nr:hypothetical protein CEXT_558921 [Caerostris extrusa]